MDSDSILPKTTNSEILSFLFIHCNLPVNLIVFQRQQQGDNGDQVEDGVAENGKLAHLGLFIAPLPDGKTTDGRNEDDVEDCTAQNGASANVVLADKDADQRGEELWS